MQLFMSSIYCILFGFIHLFLFLTIVSADKGIGTFQFYSSNYWKRKNLWEKKKCQTIWVWVNCVKWITIQIDDQVMPCLNVVGLIRQLFLIDVGNLHVVPRVILGETYNWGALVNLIFSLDISFFERSQFNPPRVNTAGYWVPCVST